MSEKRKKIVTNDRKRTRIVSTSLTEQSGFKGPLAYFKYGVQIDGTQSIRILASDDG